ncbi:galactose oxidase [bacterium]|nr:galactose oxidase [bacterium]
MKTNFTFLAGLVLIGLLGIASLATSAKWEKKADMPTPRWALSTSAVNGKIYAFGGAASGWLPAGYPPKVEVYDPATDTWEKKADMPNPRAWFSTSVVNERIYVIGGSTFPIPLLMLEEYNPATDTWTRKADMPAPRSELSTSVVNGKIYAIGGATENSIFPNVFEYDPATDTWTKKVDMPAPRAGPSTCVVNGKIYAIGGKTVVVSWQGLRSVFEYDPVTDTWTRKADMPTSRVHLSTGVINEKIYAIGGVLLGPGPLSTVEIYDPQTDTWTKGVDMPTGRTDISANVVNGKIYVVGGATGFPQFALSTVEEYTPEGWKPDAFSVSPQGKVAKTWGEIKRSK